MIVRWECRSILQLLVTQKFPVHKNNLMETSLLALLPLISTKVLQCILSKSSKAWLLHWLNNCSSWWVELLTKGVPAEGRSHLTPPYFVLLFAAHSCIVQRAKAQTGSLSAHLWHSWGAHHPHLSPLELCCHCLRGCTVWFLLPLSFFVHNPCTQCSAFLMLWGC